MHRSGCRLLPTDCQLVRTLAPRATVTAAQLRISVDGKAARIQITASKVSAMRLALELQIADVLPPGAQVAVECHSSMDDQPLNPRATPVPVGRG